MAGESDLQKLLQTMAPERLPEPYVFVSLPGAVYGDHAELKPVASMCEREGLTLVVPRAQADQSNLVYDGVFSAITLNVHSSLEAVGLTAAFATQLAEHGISANVIAGFFHDHIFVSQADAERALEALLALSSGAA